MGFDLQLLRGGIWKYFLQYCVCFTWLEMSEGLFKKQKNKKKIFHLYSTASL